MANALTAFTPVKFSLKLIEVLYNDTIYNLIANTKYEGEIKQAGDRVRVRTAAKIALSPYTKQMALVSQDLTPTSEDMIIDQPYYFKFVVDDVDKIQNDIDAINTYAANARNDMSELLDTDLLNYARKNVLGTNALGTAYVTGTAAVAATTGIVTGTGTTFTAAMVGGYMRIAGHPTGKFYLVTAYTSATQITILDLNGLAYTGGVLGATTYTINAAVAVVLTKTNVNQYLVQLGTVMSQALTPRAGRFIVVNALFEGICRQAPEFVPAVQVAYENIVLNGKIGRLANFDIIFSELVAGDNTNGFWFFAGTTEFMSFAAQIMKVSVVPSEADPNTFVATCKGLLVWGRKVFEGNRGRGAVVRATIA